MDKVIEEYNRDLDKTDAPKDIAKLLEIGGEVTIRMQIRMDWVYKSVFFLKHYKLPQGKIKYYFNVHLNT